MKQILTLLLLVLFSFENSNAQLNGPYIIGPGGNYTTFTAAVSDLKSQGVSGPVSFSVKTGMYNEQITIGKIPGQSFSNRITFNSETGNATDVTLFYTSTSTTDNYIIKFDSATHITFQNITFNNPGTTYTRNIEFKIGVPATGIQFLNNSFNAGTTSSSNNKAIIYTGGAAMDSCLFQSNTFNGGYAGINLDGPTTPLSKGLQISNNIFTNQYYSIYLKDMDAPLISGNTIINPTSRGIFIEYCDNVTQITSNKINSTLNINGIYVYLCDGTFGSRGLISNNLVQVGNTSNSAGIFINSSTYQNLYHNTVNITGTGTGNDALVVNNGSDIQIKNNIFSCETNGYALNTNSATAISSSDYNNFYSPSNYMFYRTGTSYRVLALYKTASLQESNSVSFYPGFTSSNNLHVKSSWLNNIGTVLASVTTDIDGELRNNPPDIGADEYTPFVNSPLAGVYTIGTAGNFTTFKAAIDTMKLRGISSSVTFNVSNGNYFEALNLVEIPGTNYQDTIVFQSQSANPANVTIDYTAGGLSDNFVIKFLGADRISFKNMTLSASGVSGYNTIAEYHGYSKKNNIINCILNGGTNSSSSYYAQLYSNGSFMDSTTVMGCTVNNGYGFYLLGPSTTELASFVSIINNTFVGSYNSIYLERMSSPKVNNNTIQNSTNDGIHLQYCDNDLQVISNKISSSSDRNGIYLVYCDGISAKRGLIANNFLQYGNNGTSYGIYINTSTYQNIYHNSVHITSSGANASAFYSVGGSNLQVKNNIFANSGNGFAINTNSTTNLSITDYNNLFTNGNYIANWGTTSYSDLTALKTTSGKDINSVSINPKFVSATNLHTNTYWLDGKGTPVSEVTSDYDNQLRDLTNPDIGADEFTSTLSPMSGNYTIGLAGNFTSFAQAVDSLNFKGVNGPVIFDVISGTYFEQLVLISVPGASTINTITFQSQSGNPADVTLDFTALGSGDNYVVYLNGADYILLKKMTISASNTGGNAIVIKIAGNSENTSIIDNILNGKSSSTILYAYQSSNHFNTISGNTFNGGYHCISLEGISSSVPTSSISITNNTFNTPAYHGIYLRFHDTPLIKGNIILNHGQHGIYLDYCYNDFEILSNSITSPSDYIGIYLTYCNGTSALRSVVANNFISMGNTGSGSCINIYSTNYVNVYHNSLLMNSTANSSKALYTNAGSFINIVNNNISAFGGGYAYFNATSSAISSSDYNNFYSRGNFLASWNNIDQKDFATLKTASTKEANSLSVYPGYLSTSNLHSNSFWLNDKGTPLATVTTDNDGEARNVTTPDIGADEFTSTLTPMNGAYTIGATGNYPTFVNAIDTLISRGISGPVLFNVQNGIYNEQFVINPVSNANSTNTIIFQSQSGLASDVVIDFNATTAATNYVVHLASADFITLQKMTLTASSSNSNAIVIYITGNAVNNQIKNCVINGKSTSSAIRGYTTLSENLLISGNTINSGYHSIHVEGISTSILTNGTTVTLNTIIGPSYNGIYLQNQNAPSLTSNIINNTGQDGIRLEYCDNTLQVLKNKILSVNDNSGIALVYCDGTTSNRGLIANNFVTYGNNGNANGIYTYYSNYENIYNNSVNLITGNSGTSSASFKGYYGGNINVVNNILSNNGPGYSYNVNLPSVIGTSDYNSHSTKGNRLAYWGADVVDLNALKSVSAKENSSIFSSPDFVSGTDLHISSFWLDNKATPLIEINDDIDGEGRHLTTPDIGADEFTSTLAPLAGTYIVGTGGNFTTIKEAVDSLNILGVSDSVIFLIKSGTYFEQFEIKTVSGADTIRKIRFQSQTGNPSDVVLSFTATSASDNFIVKLSNADFITFKNLTFTPAGLSGYAKAVYISGASNYVIFDQCVFNGATNNNSTNSALIHVDNSNPEFLTLTNNTFNSGGYGLYFVGISNANPAKTLKLNKNTFNYQYYPVSISYCSGVYLKSNVLNEIKADGLYFYYCSGEIKISGNKIYGTSDYTGIYLNNTNGTAPMPVLIANNFVSYGVSGGSSNGIYLYYCNYLNVYHNSVQQRSSTAGSTALNAYFGSNINTVNNIFSNSGVGYSYYTNNGTNISNSNYNNLYTNGSYLAYWSANHVNLTSLQGGSGKDINSLSLFPTFISSSDLHLKSLGLNNKGTFLLNVPMDIDDQVRDTLLPDMGADEFNISTSPLSGIYTIGTGGYFTTLAQAIDSLTTLGVSDSVIFQFKTGTYNERVEINSVSGATAIKKVVFESQTGNPQDVVIFNSATGITDNYIFNLKNSKYISFRKLTLKGTGTSYASIFTLSGEAGNISISNCILEGKQFGSGYENALIRSSYTVIDSISVYSNKMTNGGYGIYLYGLNSSNLINGVKISGNEFTGFYYSLYLNYCNAPLVVKNKMISSLDRSIHIENCPNGTQISQNILYSDNGNYGIYITFSIGTPGANGYISNNSIQLGANLTSKGIYTDNSTYQNFYNNSIHISGLTTGSSALHIANGGNINVINNILVNSGNGFAYYVNTISAIQNSDFNDLYSKGTNLGYWNGNQTNLSAFRSASGKEGSSVSANPLFETKTDLHCSAVEIYEKGTPLTAIGNDIDGELRDPVKPDIGADEIICSNPIVAFKADTVCIGDTSQFINLSTKLRTWSTYQWDILNNGSIDFTKKDSIFQKFDSMGVFAVKLIISNPIGCKDSTVDSAVVVTPNADAGFSTAVCRGSKVQLKASPGKIYKWWPSLGLSDTTIVNPFASPVSTTTYYVEVTENSGCISIDSVTVFVKTPPNAYAGPDLSINFGDSITISAAPGGETYNWDNGMKGQKITIAPSFTRTYTLFVTKNGCGSKDEITIFVSNSPLPSFSFNNKLFGKLPDGPTGPDNCSEKAFLSITTKDPASNTQIYGQCSNQISTTYSGIAADRFRMIFGDQNLTYHENVDANRQKMMFTKGTASLQFDSTGSGGWKNILILKNVSTLIEFICPDTFKGKMRGEISGGDPGFYAEYTSTGNNQILAEITSLSIDSIYYDSLGNKIYTAFDYTFELLPVERPVYVNGLGIVAPGDLMSFQNTGVSLDFNAYFASSDSASATVVFYPFDPPHTTTQDTIATIFNNEFWELGSTLDAFQVEVCFNYDSTKLHTSDLQYLSLAYQEYIGGPWTIVSGTPSLSGDKICIVTEHFSNWTIALTKPEAYISIDTVFINSTAEKKLVTKDFSGTAVSLSMSLDPGKSDTVFFDRFTINPGGDLPDSITKLGDNFWELRTSFRDTVFMNLEPESAGEVFPAGKVKVLYRPDPVTDWTEIPATRVKKSLKEKLYIKAPATTSDASLRGHFVFAQSVDSIPMYSVNSSTDTVCKNDTTHFTAMIQGGVAPFTYSWKGDDGFTSGVEKPFYIFPSGSGLYNYTLIVTDANATVDSVSGKVLVYNEPPADAGTEKSICFGKSASLQGSGGVLFVWTPASSLSSSTISNPIASPTQTIIYRLKVTDQSGCVAYDSVKVIVNSNPIISLGKDTTICDGCSIVLNSGTTGLNYLWSTGEVAPTISVDTAGLYSLFVTDLNSCTGTDTIRVDITTFYTEPDPLLNTGEVMEIYPNPNKGKFNVVFNAKIKTDLKVEIFNIQGKKIYDENFSELIGKFSEEFSVARLAHSTYILRLTLSYPGKTGKEIKRQVIRKVISQE